MRTLIGVLLAVLIAVPSNPTIAVADAPVPQTRDSWRSVRTNNLLVIGNADAEKLRQVAAWLEFFHSAFARLVSRNVLDASVPTTVILFRDEASFTPFKPLYQGRPANVAGFFQPGEDVNYIAISLDPGERDPFSTAFHEYVHLHLKDNVPNTPLWLNEGLAEFYGTMQFSGGEATLGAPLNHYIRLLREQEMLPLSTLFSIGTNSPHYNEQEKSGVFYGESWALVHYLMLGGGNTSNGRQEKFKRFLQQVSRGDSAAKALEDAFGTSLATVEDELKAYVRRGEFSAMRIATADPEAYASYTAMQRSSLTEGEANFYLGDLLFHINREADAERYFKQAVTLEPTLLQAHAALGQIYTYQKRYAEAKKHLQRATESPQSYLVHYLYAFVLSREGLSATGRITDYSRETAALIREQLLQSIKLAASYAPSRYLLALVDLVTNERLDEALEMAQKARQLAPAKANYALLLAQIHLRRSEQAEARAILESLSRSSDTAVRTEAQGLLDSLAQGNTNAGVNRGATSSRQVSGAMITEPAESGSSPRMIGGGSGGTVEIRDGQTIEASGSLPSVDDVLSRYIEAMGGAATINKYSSRIITGTLDVGGISRGGSFEQYAQAPNKFLMVMQAHPFGKMQMGFNGKSGWLLADARVQPITGVDLAILQRDADFYSPLRTKNNYAKITLPGMSKIGYREVYVLDLQPTTGPLERLYLDAETFLPVRMNTVRTVGRAGEPVEVYFDDWRDVDGVKYPFNISQSSPSLKLGFTVKEIRHNVAIDAKMFESSRAK
ncbi:MAG TPA: tetratricopeptide repeat protein [Pyrinomonadaceae bacterium]|nr:tetratricopeptide repeat protein [Pyrinomonadaceae bacterium]